MNNIKSSKPKKQRKFHYTKPLHRKQQGLAAHVDKKISGQLGVKSLALRKGDTVRIDSGKNKEKTGKIVEVNYKKGVVFIEKIVRKKANGEEVPVPIHASNLIITDADKSDAKRFKGRKKAKKPTEETKKKV